MPGLLAKEVSIQPSEEPPGVSFRVPRRNTELREEKQKSNIL